MVLTVRDAQAYHCSRGTELCKAVVIGNLNWECYREADGDDLVAWFEVGHTAAQLDDFARHVSNCFAVATRSNSWMSRCAINLCEKSASSLEHRPRRRRLCSCSPKEPKVSFFDPLPSLYHREDELHQCWCYFVLFSFFISFVQKLLLGFYGRSSVTSGFDNSCGFKPVCMPVINGAKFQNNHEQDSTILSVCQWKINIESSGWLNSPWVALKACGLHCC